MQLKYSYLLVRVDFLLESKKKKQKKPVVKYSPDTHNQVI